MAAFLRIIHLADFASFASVVVIHERGMEHREEWRPRRAEIARVSGGPSAKQIAAGLLQATDPDVNEKEAERVAEASRLSAFEDQRQDASATLSATQQLRQDAAATFNFFNTDAETIKAEGAYLPHWHQDGVIYFVTFRLADSLPQEKLKGFTEEKELWQKESWDHIVRSEASLNRFREYIRAHERG